MTEATNNTEPESGLIGWLAHERSMSGWALSVLAAVFAALAGYWGYQNGLADWPRVAWSAGVALSLLAGAVWQLTGTHAGDLKAAARVLYLATTAAIGTVSVVIGIIVFFRSMDAVTRLLRDGERDNLMPVVVALAAILLGLFVMFHGLQVGRVDERRNAIVRRFVHGMNAVLSGFLLLVVLCIGNVLCYHKLPGVIDATRSGMYSLSDRSVGMLRDLDRNIRVYLLMRPGRREYEELRTLLGNCQEKTNRITVETINPATSAVQVKDLAKKYPQIMEDAEGVLIVAGEERSDNAAYVRARDLITFDRGGDGRETEKFQGEVVFFTELTNLMGGKDKAIVYVLQGNGEPDITATGRRPPGMGVLREKLQRRNLDIRPLKVEAADWKVPDDAKILIAAGAKRPYSQAVADGIKAFMDRGGKMMAFVDPIEGSRGAETYSPTGLESVLAAHGVELTNETIFGVVQHQMGLQEGIIAEVPNTAASLPLATPFLRQAFTLRSFRNIRAAERGTNPGLTATPFLTTIPGQLAFTETDPRVSFVQTVQSIIERSAEVKKKVLTGPVTFAVMVSANPIPNPHEPKGTPTPRLAVFGESTFLLNESIATDTSSLYYDLVASTVEWLRGRTASIGLEPRTYQNFELKADAETRRGQIIYLPLLVAIVAIVGVGLGVWIVRRQ